MNVFLTGATGYIGFSVAQAFRRAGHQVWGLTRSAAKAQRVLGWEPKHYLFVDEADTCFKAWRAWQDHPFVVTPSELEQEPVSA